MSFRLHKFVLALCVTLCLAVALWPREPGPPPPAPVQALGLAGSLPEPIAPMTPGNVRDDS
jgi:hypothetical protein